MLATHSGKLERWLGLDECERISAAVKDWYGPPIAVGSAPGAVWACRGGDFRGRITAGQMSPLIDYYEQRLKRAARRAARRQLTSVHAGFASLSDLISEATVGGKARRFTWQKGSVAAVNNGAVSFWNTGNVPTSAASPAAAAPAGEVPTSATLGAQPFNNPTGGDTQHFVGGRLASAVIPMSVLLYDRIFQVAKTMNSNATEAVTGVPTRYQSSTRGAADFAGGNFAFPEVGTTGLATGAHNWTVCRYRNQSGTDAISFPSTAGINSSFTRRVDLAAPMWFMPLAAGDDGVMDLDQMQYDTSLLATGHLSWVIGHPIAFMTAIRASEFMKEDGILTAFNLTRIFDDAALATLGIHSDTTTPSFTAIVDTVAG
jgi:hypothetical protein